MAHNHRTNLKGTPSFVLARRLVRDFIWRHTGQIAFVVVRCRYRALRDGCRIIRRPPVADRSGGRSRTGGYDGTT